MDSAVKHRNRDKAMLKDEIRSLLVASREATSRLRKLTPKYLEETRQEHGWTQPEMARRLGISQTYISLIETGERPMSLDLHWRLLAILEEKPCSQCGQSTMIDTCPHCGYEAQSGR